MMYSPQSAFRKFENTPSAIDMRGGRIMQDLMVLIVFLLAALAGFPLMKRVDWFMEHRIDKEDMSHKKSGEYKAQKNNPHARQ